MGGYGDDTFVINASNLTSAQGVSGIFLGGLGNDTYIYNLAAGGDVHIVDLSVPGYGNSLVFGSGIGYGSLQLSLGSLRIKVGENGGVIHLENFDPGDVYGAHAIETFEFADGTVLSYADLIARGFDLAGTDGDDVITGTNATDRISGGLGDDRLDGRAGNDTLTDRGGSNFVDGGAGNDWIWVDGSGANLIYGGAGNDTVQASFDANNTIDGGEGDDYLLVHRTGGSPLTPNTFIGGRGNDRLFGSASTDTFIYNRDDGSDTINDYDYGAQGAIDTFQFGEGISSNDISTSRSGDHLLLRVSDPANPAATDQITIQWWFADPIHHHVERFAFTDGTILTEAQIQAWGYAPILQSAVADSTVDEDALFTYNLAGHFRPRWQEHADLQRYPR